MRHGRMGVQPAQGLRLRGHQHALRSGAQVPARGDFQTINGVGYQPDGDTLPDYITFCLDCHQHKLGTIMPIFWGGGFPPGVNSGQCDGLWPYDCVTGTGSEPHGFDAANSPAFGCCTTWDTTSCAAADAKALNPLLYNEPAGRGFDAYGRHPYETEERWPA